MSRVFGLDMLACPRYRGRLRLLATIDQADVIRRNLSHLGLPPELPTPRPARAPALADAAAWHNSDPDLPVYAPAP